MWFLLAEVRLFGMYTRKHESQIMQALRLHRSRSVIELARLLGVSNETVRRNIKPLAEKGLVLKVHGGVILPEPVAEQPFQRRMLDNQAAKQRIASVAAQQVHNGDSLMLDNGSTTAYIALALSEHANLVVVTNSAEVARTLATRNGNQVYMAGGKLRADDAAAFGPAALAFVEQFEVQHAFLSVAAITSSIGFMDFHLCEVELSRVMMRCAERTVICADSSKFEGKGLVKVCNLEEVDLLITDAPPSAELRKRFDAVEVQVSVAEN